MPKSSFAKLPQPPSTHQESVVVDVIHESHHELHAVVPGVGHGGAERQRERGRCTAMGICVETEKVDIVDESLWEGTRRMAKTWHGFALRKRRRKFVLAKSFQCVSLCLARMSHVEKSQEGTHRMWVRKNSHAKGKAADNGTGWL